VKALTEENVVGKYRRPKKTADFLPVYRSLSNMKWFNSKFVPKL
jgi:hypothetical protein